LYPVLDEEAFRLDLQKHYEQSSPNDSLWLLLLRAVLSVASLDYQYHEAVEYDMETWRRVAMAQIIASSHMIYTQMSLRSGQILFLVVSSCPFLKTLLGIEICSQFFINKQSNTTSRGIGVGGPSDCLMGYLCAKVVE